MLGQKAGVVHPLAFSQRMTIFLCAGFLRQQREKRPKDRHLPFGQKKGRANARPKSNREVITGKKNSITRYEAGDRRMRVILQGFWRQPQSMADMRFVHGSFL
jgi:ribosomal protein L19E